MNRLDAIKATAQNLGDLLFDETVASAYASAIRLDELIMSDALQLQGKYAYISGGGLAGQSRVCGSIHTTNREILFTHSFTTTPTISSNALVTDYFRKSDYDNAIDRMIGKAKIKFLEDVTATMALVATQYEYAVPSGFDYIETLRLIPSSNTDYASVDKVNRIYEIPPRYWEIHPNSGGTYVIMFDSRKISLTDFNNVLVNVIGQARPQIQATDNATLDVDIEEFTVMGASMLLASQRINENDEWRRKFYMFRDDFRPLDDFVHSYPRGKKVTR